MRPLIKQPGQSSGPATCLATAELMLAKCFDLFPSPPAHLLCPRPDPLLLTAALEALAAAPPCPGSGPDARQMLVGDSALATTTDLSAELQAANMAGQHHPHLHGASWHAGCSDSASGGGSSGPDALPGPKDAVHLLSSSWDVADAALAHDPMPMVQLGGSAPTAPPGSSPPPSKHGSASALHRLGGSQVRDHAAPAGRWARAPSRLMSRALVGCLLPACPPACTCSQPLAEPFCTARPCSRCPR